MEGLVHGCCRILEGRLTIGNMQEHGFDRGGSEVGERLFDARFDLGRFVRTGSAVEDLGMDGESRGGPGLTETVFGTHIVARRVDGPVTAIVEYIEQGLDFFYLVDMDDARERRDITDLDKTGR